MNEGYELGWVALEQIAELIRDHERGRESLFPKQPIRRRAGGGPTGVGFLNTTNYIIPAYAVMRVTGMAGSENGEYVTVDQPNGTFDPGMYLVNHGIDIPVADGVTTGYGTGTWLRDAGIVLYNTSSGTPAYGESWGPKNGQWTLEKWRYGFTVMGGIQDASTSPTLGARVFAKQFEALWFQGTTDAEHLKGATGTISILDGDEVDTTDNMADVRNDFANLAAGVRVYVQWMGGAWVLYAGDCSTY